MGIAKSALAAIFVAAIGCGRVTAATDGSPEGVEISATAYETVPSGATFRLEAADNSELTLQVQRLVRTHLQRLGYAVGGESPLVLTIGTEVSDVPAETTLPLKLQGSKGSLGLRFLLFGPNSSGLLQDKTKPAPGDYRISLSIHDQRMPGYLWRGVAATCRCGQGMLVSSREMVPALVESIGLTVGPPATESTALP